MASNIEVASYDPKKVNLVMNGKIITGFASDSMITIARNEDTVTTGRRKGRCGIQRKCE